MGVFKPLIKIDGKPLLQRVIQSFKRVVDKTVVVLGHNAHLLIPLVEQEGASYIINESYREGMSVSFKTGLRECLDCEAVFLALGDQPFVDSKYLQKAIAVWKSGAKIVSPVYKGKKGHPVLLDRSLFGEFLQAPPSVQIREIIRKHAAEHVLIETGRWSILDLDFPEDLATLRSATP
jgi:molybdenum cofactor cytidylyltransferase